MLWRMVGNGSSVGCVRFLPILEDLNLLKASISIGARYEICSGFLRPNVVCA